MTDQLTMHASETPQASSTSPQATDISKLRRNLIVIDDVSDSDLLDLHNYGLPYNDHCYLGKRIGKKTHPLEPDQEFPVLQGLAEMPQYMDEEQSGDSRSDSRHDVSFSRSHPRGPRASDQPGPCVEGIAMQQKKQQTRMQTNQSYQSRTDHPGYRRPFNTGQQPMSVMHPSVTAPRKSGRPSKETPPQGRLLHGAALRQGIQFPGALSQAIQIPGSSVPYPVQLPVQMAHQMQETITSRHPVGAAPLVTPSRGHRPTPRGKSATSTRREIAEESSGMGILPAARGPVLNSSMSRPAPLLPPPRSLSTSSPRRGIGNAFEGSPNPEEAHRRRMMEAAANALVHTPPAMAYSRPLPPTILQHPQTSRDEIPVSSPRAPPAVIHQQPIINHTTRTDEHIIASDIPRTPGRMPAVVLNSPGMDRRRLSESISSESGLISGVPVTPRPRGRPRGSRSRSSHSSSAAISNSAIVSPTRQPLSASPRRALPVTPGRVLPPSMPSVQPSTMVSAAMAMTAAPQQTTPPYRNLSPQHPSAGFAAPLISAGGSVSYTPRQKRKQLQTQPEQDNTQIEAQVREITDKIMKGAPTATQGQRSNRLLEEPLSPREDTTPTAPVTNGVSRKGRGRSSGAARSGRKAPAPARVSSTEEEEEEEDDDDSKEEGITWVVACICGAKKDDKEAMVACDNPGCIRWQHIDCIFPTTKKAPAGEYFCTQCKKRTLEWTPDDARRYQEGVRARKKAAGEDEHRKKLAEKKKQREAEQRRTSSAQQKAALPAPSLKIIHKNEFSKDVRRLMGAYKRGNSSSGEILERLKSEPRARALVVAGGRKKGLGAIKDIDGGNYILELCGMVQLPRECSGREKVGSIQPNTFLFTNGNGDNIIIDCRRMGNDTRFVRRSCKPNAKLGEINVGSETHFILVATANIASGEEVLIPFDNDYEKCSRSLDCACLDDDKLVSSCIIGAFNKALVNKGGGTSRRSLPSNGLATPQGRSPIRKAVTDHKRADSVSSASTTTKPKRGTAKPQRAERKSRAVIDTDAEETAEIKTETKEEEPSPTKSKEDPCSPSRPRRDSAKTVDSPKKEIKDEPLTSPATPKVPAKRGRKPKNPEPVEEVKKEEESEPEVKKQRRVLVEKKAKKELPVVNYTLPSERNKPTREELKLQRLLEQFDKESKTPARKRSVGSEDTVEKKKRGQRSAVANSTVKEESPALSPTRPKRRVTETSEAEAPSPSTTSSSARLRGKQAALPSNTSGNADATAVSEPPSVPTNSKKQWAGRWNKQEQMAAEAAASPTRLKRTTRREQQTAEILAGFAREGVRGRGPSEESLRELTSGGGIRAEMHANMGVLVKTFPPSEFTMDQFSIAPTETTAATTGVVSTVEVAVKTPKKISMEEYRKRKQTEGTAGSTTAPSKEGDEPKKKSFIPSPAIPSSSGFAQQPSAVLTEFSSPLASLPSISQRIPSGRARVAQPWSEAATAAEPVAPSEAAPAPSIAKPKMSINERLANEFGINTPSGRGGRSPRPSGSPAPAPSTRLASSRSTKASDIAPPGALEECPRPASMMTPSSSSRPQLRTGRS